MSEAYEETPLIHIVLTRRALQLALPATEVARGGSEDVYVLFDGTEGDPPRRLTIVVTEDSERSSWDMQVTTAPPVSGRLLVTVGVQSFSGRFDGSGAVAITGIPSVLLADEDGPPFELAILPPRA
ncbi:MAG: hypothetical protein OHK0015_50310 [Chloroflexi bacterium OHK40]